MQKWKSLSNKRKLTISGSGILGACIACTICVMLIPEVDNDDIDQQEITQTAIIEEVGDLTTPENSESRAVPSEAEDGSVAGLPGTNPADITVSLEERGLRCNSVEIWEATEDFPREIYYRVCEKNTAAYDIIVELYGYKLLSVDAIVVSVRDYAEPYDDIAIPLLGFIATTPYDTAEPIEARSWVEETLPLITENEDVRMTDFGGVVYKLYGSPTSRVLEIGQIEE